MNSFIILAKHHHNFWLLGGGMAFVSAGSSPAGGWDCCSGLFLLEHSLAGRRLHLM